MVQVSGYEFGYLQPSMQFELFLPAEAGQAPYIETENRGHYQADLYIAQTMYDKQRHLVKR